MQYDTLVKTIELSLPDNLQRLERLNCIEQKLEKNQLSVQQIYKQISNQMRRFIRLLISRP